MFYKSKNVKSGITILLITILSITLVPFSIVYAESEATESISVTSVALDKSSLGIVAANTETLTATVEPEDATNKNVLWSSADPSIATVTDGDVTAVSEGNTTITVMTEDGEFTAECIVTVSLVAIEKIELDKEKELNIGEQVQLTPTITPSDGTNKNVRWASSDEQVATVTDGGMVKGVGAGQATITVTTQEGGKQATCLVAVRKPVDSVSLDIASMDMCQVDTVTLTASVLPEDAYDKSIVWTTSDAQVASVSDSGEVTAVAEGQATITAASKVDSEKTADCIIEVVSDTITSTIYTIEDDTLRYAGKNTSAAQLLGNIVNSHKYLSVAKKDGAVYTGDAVGTGMKVKLTVGGKLRDECIVLVLGDGNGDGCISISDYTLTRLDILSLKKLSNHYKLACDINGDGKITISDYTLMRLDILGLKNIGGELVKPDPNHPNNPGYLDTISDSRIRSYLKIALAQQGAQYVWGAEGPYDVGFDCSGFVFYCLSQSGYKPIYRTTAQNYSDTPDSKWPRVEKKDLKPGDLMFYKSDETRPGRYIGHIGIYLGNGYHIHASSDYACILICRMEGWYDEMFEFGRRVYK